MYRYALSDIHGVPCVSLLSVTLCAWSARFGFGGFRSLACFDLQTPESTDTIANSHDSSLSFPEVQLTREKPKIEK